MHQKPYCALHDNLLEEASPGNLYCPQCEGEKIAIEGMADITNTPTPETDAVSRECLRFVTESAEEDGVIQIPALAVTHHRMRKLARSLETRLRAAVDRTHEAQVQIIDLSSRLRAAEAELAAMRSGEVVAWMHEGSSREGSMAFVTPGTYASLKEKSPYTIPLFRAPAPDAVAEAIPKVWDAETIKDAPDEGAYAVYFRGHQQVISGRTFLTLKSAKEIIAMDNEYVVVGPYQLPPKTIPHPSHEGR